MILEDIMDELAVAIRTIPTLAGRTYAYPPGAVTPPAAIVTYPDDITFDGGYGRGMDRITGNVVVVAGQVTDRGTRALIAGYLDGSGAESVKTAIEGAPYVHLDSVRVTRGEFDTVPIAGIDYIAVLFELDIVGPGAT